MILKVVNVGSTEDKDWLELFEGISHVSSFKEYLTDKNIKAHNVNVERFNESIRKAFNTSNVVVAFKTENSEKELVFVELDYLYNGEELGIEKVFHENGEYFAKVY